MKGAIAVMVTPALYRSRNPGCRCGGSVAGIRLHRQRDLELACFDVGRPLSSCCRHWD